MRNIMRVILLLGAVIAANAAVIDKDLCSQKLECTQTNYKEYLKCNEKRRIKRQTCPFSNVVPPIPLGNSAAPVQNNVIPAISSQPCAGSGCPTPCSGNACSTPCTGTSCSNSCVNSCINTCGGASCNDRCERSCAPPPPPIIPQVIQPPPQPPIVIPQHPPASPNVTTVIKLTNIVNNTNVVNVPTNINNTNVNNIELDTNSTSTTSDSNKKCCVVVQPKVCHKLPEKGYRCFHRRHHTCGEQCVSKTLHAQVRQKCQGDIADCPFGVSYVPQPKSRCHYQETWPYVSCDGEADNCDGCYDHYGYGAYNYYGGAMPEHCRKCYDDGIENGPLYRPGPYYQPYYYHTPPTTPGCETYGCYGNQMVNPVFYQHPQVVEPQPQYIQQPIQYIPQPVPMPQPVIMPAVQPVQYVQPSPYYAPSYSYYPSYPSSYYPPYQPEYFEAPEIIMVNSTLGNFSFVDDNFEIGPEHYLVPSNGTLFAEHNLPYPMAPSYYTNPYYNAMPSYVVAPEPLSPQPDPNAIISSNRTQVKMV